MCELTDKYDLYKKAIEIQKNYFNFPKKGSLKLKCSNCEKMITINGCTSHYKKCKTIYNDKFKFILSYFN